MSDLGPTLGAALDAAENAWAQIVDDWSAGYCRAAATPLADQNSAFTEGFVAGRTVTAEQVAAVTLEFAQQTKVPFERMPSHHQHYWRQITIAALRAAGFLIEGDDDA